MLASRFVKWGLLYGYSDLIFKAVSIIARGFPESEIGGGFAQTGSIRYNRGALSGDDHAGKIQVIA
jgi:hypothetical protein